MNRTNRRCTAASLGAGILGVIDIAGALGAVAIPESLSVPSSEKRVLEAHATGYQIYACSAKSDGSGFEWTLKAPEADLFDGAGKKIGRHYAGPTRESVDGSRVVGEVKARVDAPDGNGIPWLLLRAKSTAGKGVLGDVASIQRVATVGGKAPAEGCDQTHLGAENRVAYTATYNFYASGAEESSEPPY
jgi:hypothetical protein